MPRLVFLKDSSVRALTPWSLLLLKMCLAALEGGVYVSGVLWTTGLDVRRLTVGGGGGFERNKFKISSVCCIILLDCKGIHFLWEN